ncbi:MAG: DUF4277 domain-containing protein [Candidatus Entotheonellia bacterium]
MCRRIWLIEEIDSSVGSSEWMMTVGEAGQAMVLNALRGASRVLYLSPEFCVNKPVELLIREGLQAEDLNTYGDRAGAVRCIYWWNRPCGSSGGGWGSRPTKVPL